MTQNDLKQIGDLIDKKFKEQDTKLDKRFDSFGKYVSVLIDTKLDSRIGKLEQEMFEWRSEMVNSVDVFMKEINKNREFMPIVSYRTADNTKRIEKLEIKVFGVAEN